MVNAPHDLDQLRQLLTRESSQCDLLAQNILQGRDAMKRMALHEFLSINQTRVSLLECLSALKEEFDAVVHRLTAAHGLPEGDWTFAGILQRTRSPQSDEIVRQYERLAEQVRAVKQEIAVNQLLVKNIQSFLVKAMEAHRQTAPETDLYSMSGGLNSSGSLATLIRRKG